jgi:hypothetical protein
MSGVFGNQTSNTRALLFYGICIWVRLALVFLVYKYAKNKTLLYSLLAISFISIYLNFSKIHETVWWSRYVHGIDSIILFIVCLLAINNKINKKSVSYVLLWDVLFGIIYSLYKKPFLV